MIGGNRKIYRSPVTDKPVIQAGSQENRKQAMETGNS